MMCIHHCESKPTGKVCFAIVNEIAESNFTSWIALLNELCLLFYFIVIVCKPVNLFQCELFSLSMSLIALHNHDVISSASQLVCIACISYNEMWIHVSLVSLLLAPMNCFLFTYKSCYVICRLLCFLLCIMPQDFPHWRRIMIACLPLYLSVCLPPSLSVCLSVWLASVSLVLRALCWSSNKHREYPLYCQVGR